MGSRRMRLPTIEYQTKQKFKKLSEIQLCPIRYVKFEDFSDCGITDFQNYNLGFRDFFDYKNQKPFYPELVRLFFANSTIGEGTFTTSVKEVQMTITPAIIRKVFKVNNRGKVLSDIEMTDSRVLELMFKDKELPKGQIVLQSLTPQAKVVSKIVVHNLLPKVSGMHYLNSDQAKLVYAIISGIQFKWASFLFDQLAKDHTSCIPYGSLITLLFEHFGVDLSNEIDKDVCNKFIDKGTIKRMKLIPDVPSSSVPSSSAGPSSSLPEEIPQDELITKLMEGMKGMLDKMDEFEKRLDKFDSFEKRLATVEDKIVAIQVYGYTKQPARKKIKIERSTSQG